MCCGRTVGTCSLCGGRVAVPQFWYGVCPPTPQCSRCGALPEQCHGPVIPMEPVCPPVIKIGPPPVTRTAPVVEWNSTDRYYVTTTTSTAQL